MSLATALAAIGANMIGGIAPDIDQPTASFWNDLPAGTLLGKLIAPILGGHRFISHSILGIILFGWCTSWFLKMCSGVVLVDMRVVWWSFMIGFISHLIMDSLTKEGVPWLFPIPLRFGIPPLRFFRIKTGGIIEKSIVFPGIFLLTGYIIYLHYQTYLILLKMIIK